MLAIALNRRTRSLLFVGILTAVYATALLVTGQLSGLEARAGAVAVALTLDLVLVVPLAYYLLVVRRGVLPIVTLVPVVFMSGLAASRILPADHHQALRVLEALALPGELALIGWVAWRTAKAMKAARRDATSDLLAQLRHAAFSLTQNHTVAAVFAAEIAVVYYGAASWRARPHVPRGMAAFSCHDRSGHGGLVLAFILLMAIEGFAVHMLLQGWSTLAAWIFTIGTAYGALWLIADYRATVLRPVLVGEERMVIRAGCRFTLDVPLGRIAAVGHAKPDFGKESVNLTFLGTPTHWLTLSEPMLAEGPYGFRRRVRAIGIQPDAPEDFERTIAGRLAALGVAAEPDDLESTSRPATPPAARR